MRLDGIHHVTCITGDAPRNVDFYTRVLGLRLVKKTVNQDDPTVYHLFYADEEGKPGSDITFFEYPGARPGRAGAGMVHTVQWRVGSEAALDFWEERLSTSAVRDDESVAFEDPEGLRHRLVVSAVDDEPLIAEHPEVPAEHALQGFDAVRAYAVAPDASRELLVETLGFVSTGENAWEARGAVPRRALRVRGGRRPSAASAARAPSTTWRGRPRWTSIPRGTSGWRPQAMHPSPIIDRFWFRSIYFREPNGILFEIATLGPGFSLDEDPERLGESLILPPAFEHLRSQIEPILTPLPDPRPWAKTG